MSTQAEVDQFAYSEVTGSLYIGGSDITNFEGMASLTSIGGILQITSFAADLTGFSKLTSVGSFVSIQGGPALLNLDGLDGLEAASGLYIRDNPLLERIDALSTLAGSLRDLLVVRNPQLQSLDGLASVSSVVNLSISGNDNLENVDGLSGIDSVGGNLVVHGNASLRSIEGLSGLDSVGGDVDLYDNASLASLAGLGQLRVVGGRFYIRNNAGLESLDGLGSPLLVGVLLSIQNNPNLAEVDGLKGFRFEINRGGMTELNISENNSLLDVDGLEGLDSLDVWIAQNPLLTECTCGLYDFVENQVAGSSLILSLNGAGCNQAAILASGPCTVGPASDMTSLSPVDGSSQQGPIVQLAWDPIDNISRYHLKVAVDGDFQFELVNDRAVRATQYSLSSEPEIQTYFWKVRSRGKGEWGPWSPVRSFQVGDDPTSGGVSPELVSPADGAAGQPESVNLVWMSVPHAVSYDVDLSTNGNPVSLTNLVVGEHIQIDEANLIRYAVTLEPNTAYEWRVRANTMAASWPWSESRALSTADEHTIVPGPLLLEDGSPAFVQIEGIGDDDACGPRAGSTYGCAEVGGNSVYASYNGQQNWIMYRVGEGPEESIGYFTPNDFEIRVTEAGSYGVYAFQDNKVVWVPFETWDIGPTGPFGVNDPADDIQMAPILLADNGGTCSFGFGELPEDAFALGWPGTDRIYSYYLRDGVSYESYAASAAAVIAADPSGCPNGDDVLALIDLDRGRPLQDLVFSMDPSAPVYRETMIPQGNVVRFLTTKGEGSSPTQSSPADLSTVMGPAVTFWWIPVDEIFPTQLQVSDSDNFAGIVLDTLVTSDNFTWSGAAPDGQYYWRVKHSYSEWSISWEFTVAVGTASESDASLPTEFALHQNYPNPFNPSTTIRYNLPEAAVVRLTVFDALGRIVESLVNEPRPAGKHHVNWEANGMSSGMYFINLEAGSHRSTRTVTLLR